MEGEAREACLMSCDFADRCSAGGSSHVGFHYGRFSAQRSAHTPHRHASTQSSAGLFALPYAYRKPAFNYD